MLENAFCQILRSLFHSIRMLIFCVVLPCFHLCLFHLFINVITPEVFTGRFWAFFAENCTPPSAFLFANSLFPPESLKIIRFAPVSPLGGGIVLLIILRSCFLMFSPHFCNILQKLVPIFMQNRGICKNCSIVLRSAIYRARPGMVAVPDGHRALVALAWCDLNHMSADRWHKEE